MKIEGKLQKIGKFWAADIPLLLIYTQGTSRKNALEMAVDAVETVVDRAGFKSSAALLDDSRFVIGANSNQILFATILRRQRIEKELSIRDVATLLGSNSPTSYSRYETGETSLTLDRFTQLLGAINSDYEPVMTLQKKPLTS